jgi:hypothetical protein
VDAALADVATPASVPWAFEDAFEAAEALPGFEEVEVEDILRAGRSVDEFEDADESRSRGLLEESPDEAELLLLAGFSGSFWAPFGWTPCLYSFGGIFPTGNPSDARDN